PGRAPPHQPRAGRGDLGPPRAPDRPLQGSPSDPRGRHPEPGDRPRPSGPGRPIFGRDRACVRPHPRDGRSSPTPFSPDRGAREYISPHLTALGESHPDRPGFRIIALSRVEELLGKGRISLSKAAELLDSHPLAVIEKARERGVEL